MTMLPTRLRQWARGRGSLGIRPSGAARHTSDQHRLHLRASTILAEHTRFLASLEDADRRP